MYTGIAGYPGGDQIVGNMGMPGGTNLAGSAQYYSGLPTVTDPEKAYADMTRQQYLDYVKNYQPFELALIEKAKNDKSLIESARKDVATASTLATGVASRNAQRFGYNLSPDAAREQELRLQRANTLGGIQSVNDAKLAQRDANDQLMANLINIGQGLNRSANSQLGSAAQDAAARNAAYKSAKAASKAQTYSTIGSLASTAILAFAFF